VDTLQYAAGDKMSPLQFWRSRGE